MIFDHLIAYQFDTKNSNSKVAIDPDLFPEPPYTAVANLEGPAPIMMKSRTWVWSMDSAKAFCDLLT